MTEEQMEKNELLKSNLAGISELIGKSKEQQRICKELMAIAEDETRTIELRQAMLVAINHIIETDK